jgi:hypothetical protein
MNLVERAANEGGKTRAMQATDWMRVIAEQNLNQSRAVF